MTNSNTHTFDEIYTLYFKKVLKYLISIMGRKYAEDAAQETFIKIHKNMNKLKEITKMSSWIYKIALNSARDIIRKESKIKTPKKSVDYQNREPQETDIEQIEDKNSYKQDEILIKKEMIECYVNFVKKLPKKYFEVYVLSEIDELSNREISKKLSLPLETVKTRLHRARKDLYEVLRARCSCYHNERGELMGELKQS